MSGLSSRDLANLKSALDEAAIVAITDKRGLITYVNKKFCDISKYSADELIGRTHKIINSGLHSPEFFSNMWKTISEGRVWEGEIRNRSKDGRHYWMHTTIVPFMDQNGRPESYASVRFEITERIRAQERLKVSNRELQDFAYVAAHDLQEPLRKLRTFSDRLVQKAAPLLPVDLLDYLNRIQNSAERMQTLINDLLSYSRVTTKAEPFQMVDLNVVAAQVVSDLEIRIDQSNGKVRLHPLPTIDGDGTQIHQLLQNLISNALKFSQKDIAPIVDVSAEETATGILLKVADNGIGFEEKYLDRIFTIFQRLHGRFEYEGTGIGLAICKKIVERHGGTLTANSVPNQGSTFYVRLPKHQGEIA